MDEKRGFVFNTPDKDVNIEINEVIEPTHQNDLINQYFEKIIASDRMSNRRGLITFIN